MSDLPLNGLGEFSLPIRVYIEDTDAGGIVYYVNYLKYIERARTEFMRSLGMDRATIFNDELMFVVSDVSISYSRPALLDDDLEATAALIGVGGASLKLKQCVRRGNDLVAEAAVSLACVSPETLAPRRIPKAMLATLRAAHDPQNGLGE
ncbi:tol-pal system-associated acyl-CoA thioesterase [Congregibacter sp.]|uniref:tol-pal system-associated acyl-CoA thioesterase n=1 Tax=Congregibacter sp. TaxID=2744308 RepID=UPI003858F785